MTRRYLSILLLSGVVLTLAGCTMAKFSGRGIKPLMLNSPPTRAEVIARISVSKGVYFDYTGSFDVSEVLADRLIGSDADALANCTITVKSTFANFAVNLITLGLANARTFQVEGDLVRLPEGLSSLEEAGYERLASAPDIGGLMDLVPVEVLNGSEAILLKEDGPDGGHVFSIWGTNLGTRE